jgi:hypothetical protein
MDALLRWYAQWRGRSRAAQVIVFDGGAEVEKTRHFFRGAVFGIAVSFVVMSLAAPGSVDPALLTEVERRGKIAHDANEKAAEAAKIASLCLNTAQHMEWTLEEYRSALARR